MLGIRGWGQQRRMEEFSEGDQGQEGAVAPLMEWNVRNLQISIPSRIWEYSGF
jgi:hypothetical protein